MRSGTKTDFPPLLAPGLHFMSVAALRALCVSPFTLSSTRAAIIVGLETVLTTLSNGRIVGDLWIDGSFVTEKVDPADVDIVLVLDYFGMNSPTSAQLQILRWFATNPDLRARYFCDSYVFMEYPREHSLFAVGQRHRDYWAGWSGKNRRDELTGMAVIEVGRR
jgi:hypothetical protein